MWCQRAELAFCQLCGQKGKSGDPEQQKFVRICKSGWGYLVDQNPVSTQTVSMHFVSHFSWQESTTLFGRKHQPSTMLSFLLRLSSALEIMSSVGMWNITSSAQNSPVSPRNQLPCLHCRAAIHKTRFGIHRGAFFGDHLSTSAQPIVPYVQCPLQSGKTLHFDTR